MQPLPRDMQAVQFLLTRPYGRDLLGTANFWLAMFLLTRPYGRDQSARYRRDWFHQGCFYSHAHTGVIGM